MQGMKHMKGHLSSGLFQVGEVHKKRVQGGPTPAWERSPYPPVPDVSEKRHILSCCQFCGDLLC